MAMASSSASPAAIFAFLAPPLSLLRHVASLCAGYLGIAGGLKPSVRAPASSSSWSSSAAAAASQRDDEVEAAASEDCTEVVVEMRSRAFNVKPPPRNIKLRESIGGDGGKIH